MPVLPGLGSHEPNRWDLSLNLGKQFLQKLVQLLPRSQWDQGCPAAGQLQLQVLALHLPGELQNYFCFSAVEYLQEENDLEEKPFAEILEAPFTAQDDVD